MAKSSKSAKTTKPAKSAAAPTRKAKAAEPSGEGRDLVIVESPAKAKTIGKYLGGSYHVLASVGHVRDLPKRAPKGVKQPVPGVDLENQFEPTYVIVDGKSKAVADLRKAAKTAPRLWFATDLDREGEAIAWHLAELLEVDPTTAQRVVFNAITKDEIVHAFSSPRAIDMDKVNAQQARRILDRIVGYMVSPFLWKKVAGGLSAGRVQSVAVRLIVDREREVLAHIPDETWKVTLPLSRADAPATLAAEYAALLERRDDRDRGVTVKERTAWLNERGCFEAELIEIAGASFELGCPASAAVDLSRQAIAVAEAVGLQSVEATRKPNPGGKGPAAHSTTVSGRLDAATRYRVAAIERKRETSRPYPPFITSTLQRAGIRVGFTTDRTMRIAQSLYETGWITYHRTDSTHISGAGLQAARDFIGQRYGGKYLPEKPRFYASSNKSAQEAHEAVRPTDPSRTPENGRAALNDDQARLYDLIWRCFVASQMCDAEYDRVTLRLERSDKSTGAVLRASGRTLTFDGFLKANPRGDDEAVTLPKFDEGDSTRPVGAEVKQVFSSPPSRYSEGSLVKALEEDGIGRPSTYASIIKTIVDREYVERKGSTLLATDLGIVVTDLLVEAFPHLLDLGFTKKMEGELDQVEEQHFDWRQMLRDFYEPFAEDLEHAKTVTTHTKAVTTPAPWACPKCGARTAYRFGKKGRFLSCGAFPECKYAAPVNRQGEPTLPERVNLRCPVDGSGLVVRQSRFGPFLTSENPETKFLLGVDKKGHIKFPSPPPVVTELTCPKCERPMNLRLGARGPWLGCSGFPRCRGRLPWAGVPEADQKALTAKLDVIMAAHIKPVLTTLSGAAVPDSAAVADYLLEGGVQHLERHGDAGADATAISA